MEEEIKVPMMMEELKEKYPNVFNFMTVKMYYILDENNNCIAADLMEWGKFFQNTKRRIVKQDIINGKWVSTVFLGINHQFLGGPPLLLETMVFESKKGGHDIYCTRYSTWNQALKGHEKAIQWVKNGCVDEIDNED